MSPVSNLISNISEKTARNSVRVRDPSGDYFESGHKNE
jgi:hypothetical protein